MLEATGGGVDYAFEATGRPEAALAAFLSTRARGAAVLIGIPRPTPMLALPALPIPRLERRILGSIYGSARPERDFPALLEPVPRGRLPLDRLVTRRVPLDAVEEAFGIHARRRRRCAWSSRPGRRRDGPPGRTDRRGLVRRGAQRQPHQRGAGAARLADGGGRGRRAGEPAPGHTPFLVCLGRERRRAAVTVFVNKTPIEAEALGRITWGAAQLGIAQGVLDAVADGLLDAARSPRWSCSRRSGSTPRPKTRRRCGARTARPCARDRRRAPARRPTRARARRAPRGRGEQLLRR